MDSLRQSLKDDLTTIIYKVVTKGLNQSWKIIYLQTTVQHSKDESTTLATVTFNVELPPHYPTLEKPEITVSSKNLERNGVRNLNEQLSR